MSVTRLAGRYAKSFFELAQEQQILDRVQEDLRYVESAYQSSSDLQNFLRNPVIGVSEKTRIFDKIFASKLAPISVKALHNLFQHRRERYLLQVCQSFNRLYREAKGISTVTLTTPVELSHQALRNLLETFRQAGLIGQQADLEQKIDPSIIGGFILQVGDTIYNASIGQQVENLRKKFNENLYIKNL